MVSNNLYLRQHVEISIHRATHTGLNYFVVSKNHRYSMFLLVRHVT